MQYENQGRSLRRHCEWNEVSIAAALAVDVNSGFNLRGCCGREKKECEEGDCCSHGAKITGYWILVTGYYLFILIWSPSA